MIIYDYPTHGMLTVRTHGSGNGVMLSLNGVGFAAGSIPLLKCENFR